MTLLDTLTLAVPLRMQELAEDIRHRGWPEELAPVVTDDLRVPWADELLYGGRHTADAFAALVHALAVLALAADGGVDYAGGHWCARAHDDEHGRPCRPVRVGHLPPWPHDVPTRPIETVAVIGGAL